MAARCTRRTVARPQLRFVALLGALLLSLVVPSAAYPQGSTLDSVTVDLNSRSFSTVVPFDVPFAIVGTADSSFKRVDGWFTEANRDHQCRILDPAQLSTSLVDAFLADQSPTRPIRLTANVGGGAKYTYLDTWMPFMTAPTFRLSAPELEPGRYYCFAFSVIRQISGDALTQFRTQVQSALDTQLRPFSAGAIMERPRNPPQPTDPPSVVEIVDSVCAEARNATSPIGLEPPPGSLCNPTPESLRSLVRDFNTNLGAVFGLQMNIRVGWQDIVANRQQARVAIDTWRTGAFPTLVRGLQQNAEAMKTFTAKWPSVTRFATLSAIEARNVATGFPLSSGLPSEELAWSQTGISEQTTGLDNDLSHLRALQDVLETVVANATLLGQAGITAAQGQELIDRVENTRAAMGGLRVGLEEFERALSSRADRLTVFVAALGDRVRTEIPVRATSLATFQTRGNWYFGLDYGFAAAPDLSLAFPYVGLNMYLRPVNKEARLRGLQFFRRFALTGGMTFGAATLTKAGQREGAVGNRMIVAGAGFRIVDSLRFVAGRLIFHEVNKDPFVLKDPEWASNWFYALSLDWDFAKAFSDRLGTPIPK